MKDRAALLEDVVTIARQAGDDILLSGLQKIRNGEASAQTKSDGSPVTAFDKASEAFISAKLRELTPEIPVVAEEKFEGLKDGHVHPVCWYVDPLDGTSNFAKGADDFCVNIGLVENDRPALGVVYAPALGQLYKGGPSLGSFRNGEKIKASTFALGHVRLLEHAVDAQDERKQKLLAILKPVALSKNYAALRHCKVAEGSFDLFWLWRTESKWDVAAGHAILQGAGGDLVHLDGSRFSYAGENVKIRDYIAHGNGYNVFLS